jgi:hypothetical protein
VNRNELAHSTRQGAVMVNPTANITNPQQTEKLHRTHGAFPNEKRTDLFHDSAMIAAMIFLMPPLSRE